MNKYNLEDRMVDFSVRIYQLCKSIKRSYEGNYFANQLLRSGTSCALNYGEAKGAESRKDFIHKMKISLKELRETYICLKILTQIDLGKNNSQINGEIKENNELISIFIKSIETTRANINKAKK